MEQIKINTIENPRKIYTVEEAEKIREEEDVIRENLLEELKSTEGEEKGREKCNNICAEVHIKEFGDLVDGADKHIFHWVLCADTISRHKQYLRDLVYDNRDRAIKKALIAELAKAQAKNKLKK